MDLVTAARWLVPARYELQKALHCSTAAFVEELQVEMTKLIRFVVIAVAIGFSSPVAQADRQRQPRAFAPPGPCDNDTARRVSQAFFASVSQVGKALAEAANATELDEIVWDLAGDADLLKASMLAGMVIAQDGGADATQCDELAQPSDIDLAFNRLVEKATRVAAASMSECSDFAQMQSEEALAAFDRALAELVTMSDDVLAPQGERWFAQGVLRMSICVMGHGAHALSMLPEWVTKADLDALLLDALSEAEKGVDMLLDPMRRDKVVAERLSAHIDSVSKTATHDKPSALFG